MGMVVRTNTMAVNAYRQLGMNNSAVAKSLEKLASGYRINRAGDDAAGLAISEKMKAQITGLETASANAQDGISLIQTAEGNLSEVHDMLNRMVELATKSANGTYTTQERSALQDEVNQLLEEIDRISQSANFNGTKLLDGTMGLNTAAISVGSNVAAVPGAKIELEQGSGKELPTRVDPNVKTAVYPTDGYHLSVDSSPAVMPEATIDLTNVTVSGTWAANDTIKVTVFGKTFTVTVATADNLAEGEISVASLTGADGTANLAKALAGAMSLTNGTEIGNLAYKATASGNQVTIKAIGLKNGYTTTTLDEELPKAANQLTNAADAGRIQISATVAAGGSIATPTEHNAINVVNGKAAIASGRAGIDFTLTDKIVADGNKLTIDGMTFVFKTDATSDVKAADGETLIDVSSYTDATAPKKLDAAADLMSHHQTDNFKIQVRDGGTGGKIHIEQLSSSQVKYTNYEKLAAVFSAKGADKGQGTQVSFTAGKLVSGDKVTIGDTTYTFVNKLTGADNEVELGTDGKDAVNNLEQALKNNNVAVDNNGKMLTIYGTVDKAPVVTGAGLTLQIGDTADPFNKMNVQVANMSAEALGLKGLSILTEGSSSDAIARVKTAINSVSTARAGMGALQNRLEHTINNLDVAAENLTAANSRIRDTDMAKEMMNYTKMNVLVQSAQAMLAQANQQPQSVLQLLQ